MAILGTDLHWYASKVVNDTNSNGGRITQTLIPTGQSNTWWPNLSESQLASGVTQYRKIFLRVDNAGNETGYNLRVGLFRPTPGSDELYLFAGTMTDIQSDISDPDLYGAGKLDSSVLSGVSSINVLVEDGATVIFREGDLIRISDQATVGGSGNAEIKEIDSVSVAGDVVTLGLTSALANGYSASATYVSSLIEQAEVKGSVGSKVVTSAAGTFNETLMTISHLGSIYQTVTLTFTSATAFTATSDEITFAAGTNTGSTLSTFAPTNLTAGNPYFSIPPSAWGGTFTTGNTVVFVTTPPAMGVWEMRKVPVGASAIASQTRTLMAFIES